jgi:hypothetical protein
MAHTFFYGLKSDIQNVFEFLFTQTDVEVFESYSVFDRELRQFRSMEELEDAFRIGFDRGGSGRTEIFQLWSPAVMPRPAIHKRVVEGYGTRYSIYSPGLIQLYLGGQHNNSTTESDFDHWDKAGYVHRAPDDANVCDWKALSRLSGRIQRHVKRHLAVAKLGSSSILPEAFAALQNGQPLLCGGKLHNADSTAIIQL